jgi:hypothetical protein
MESFEEEHPMQVQAQSWLQTRSTFVATLLSILITVGFAGLAALIFDIIARIF